VMGIALLMGILLTCCISLLVLLIPYIGTVALLPLYVFKRFIGLEFMRQFGAEYDLLQGRYIHEPHLMASSQDEWQYL